MDVTPGPSTLIPMNSTPAIVLGMTGYLKTQFGCAFADDDLDEFDRDIYWFDEYVINHPC